MLRPIVCTLVAGRARNDRAEAQIVMAVTRAQQLWQHAAEWSLDDWVQLERDGAGLVTRAIVHSPISGQTYTLDDCVTAQGCCSCLQDMQNKTCKHHVIVMRHLLLGDEPTPAPRLRRFENLLISCLGTSFGATASGGCQLGPTGLAALMTAAPGALSALPTAAVVAPARAEPARAAQAAAAADVSAHDPCTSAHRPTDARPPALTLTPGKRCANGSLAAAATAVGLDMLHAALGTLRSPARRTVFADFTAALRQAVGKAQRYAANAPQDVAALALPAMHLPAASYARVQGRHLGAGERGHQRHAAQEAAAAPRHAEVMLQPTARHLELQSRKSLPA